MANTFKLKTKANVGITTQNVYVVADSAVNTVYGDSSYGYTYFRGRLIG